MSISSRTGGGLRRIAPARLPAYDTADATTFRRSEGTEADRVIPILPNEPSPVLIRELICAAT